MSVSSIHPTAIIARTAEIDSSAVIGPYAIIEDNVYIDACLLYTSDAADE